MTSPLIPSSSVAPLEGRHVRVHAKAENVSKLTLTIEPARFTCETDEVIVAVAAAAVNPSDVKATLGLMPHAVWPRTPGRDFAGTVVEGPPHLLGTEVWGSSGELGINRDGSHATHLVIGADSVRAKPKALSLIEAGSIGVPFVTAWKGFERSGFPKPGQAVLVLGATGKVGQAAVQIATMLGARTIGVVREGSTFDGFHSAPVTILSGDTNAVAQQIRDVTGGHGADIVFNTVGSPYFELANRSLALDGTQILIATIDRAIPFDIMAFYRGRHTYVGVDTLSLSTVESVSVLAQLTDGFESGKLRPYPILESAIYPLDRAHEAYTRVLGSAKDRVVFTPNGG